MLSIIPSHLSILIKHQPKIAYIAATKNPVIVVPKNPTNPPQRVAIPPLKNPKKNPKISKKIDQNLSHKRAEKGHKIEAELAKINPIPNWLKNR